MPGRTVRSILGCSALSLLALLAGACQDYAFEELPSSVIREKRIVQNIDVASDIDILFVIDNSGSMVGEQVQLATSFGRFTDVLDEKFGAGKYQIAVITTGMESGGCPPCDAMITQSCMNETGENGRFQSRIGHISDDTTDPPTFEFTAPDPNCRIVTSANKNCFYEPPTPPDNYGRGIAFVGTNGCGYEKGLEPIRVALSDLAGTANAGFLRPNATLAIIVVSDEEDCGKVGDVTEGIAGIGGRVCYYASKGQGPDGTLVDPQAGLLYQLTPVQEYYDFLRSLKPNRPAGVKFVAVVGVEDETNPGATEINYLSQATNADVVPSCTTPGCTSNCTANPGTRYLELAEKFGLGEGGNGKVGTLCQPFDELMAEIAEFVSCPDHFNLSEALLDPALANILLNNVDVPRYSCTVTGRIEECDGPGAACSEGNCVPTWSYFEPGDPLNPFFDEAAPGGTIVFAAHYQPCDLITEGQMLFEVVYVTP